MIKQLKPKVRKSSRNDKLKTIQTKSNIKSQDISEITKNKDKFLKLKRIRNMYNLDQ